ncbi:MAG: cyclase family protein [Nitrospinota bacterium]
MARRLIDLTQRWHSRVPTWPYFPSSMVRNFHSHHKDGLMSLIIETNMHSGTHIDAPLHFNAGGWDLAEIPLDRCYGSALVVDVSRDVEEYSLVSREMIERRIPRGEEVRQEDILIIYYGWHVHNWEGEKRNEQTFFCKHPGPTPDVTDWLIEKNVKWVGSDAPAFEHPFWTMIRGYRPDLIREMEKKFGSPIQEILPEEHMLHCHRRMMARNQMHVDNIGGDIAQVAGKRVEVQIFPWRFVGGEACIGRLVAWVEE